MTKLFEDEMDRAALILATKSVVDDLQDMAEKIAKMEAEGIMPLLDGIRTNFSADIADRLSDDSTEALRDALEGIKEAKEKISLNINHMEQIVTGEGPGTDMSLDIEVDDHPSKDDQSAGDIEDERAVEPTEVDIDSIFGSDIPVGRKTKESQQIKAINMLKESQDSDRLLMAFIVNKITAGLTTAQAINETASLFQVDKTDLVEIVRGFNKK